MPSRRTLLTALASVAAGCTAGPDGTETTDSSGSQSPSATSTDAPLVSFDYVDVTDAPASEPVLVTSSEWRRWLRQAADGRTVRAAVHDPARCSRAPLDGVSSVALRDADDRSGSYDLTLETGGHYRYPFDAGPATPPEDAPVHAFDEVPEAVAREFQPLLESGDGTIEPQQRAFDFVERHTLAHEEFEYLLYVRRGDTTYRVYAVIPTYTPACGYYAVVGLSETDATPGQTLSLAGGNEIDGSEKVGGDARRLTAFPAGTRALLREYEYVLTLTGCYRLEVYD